MGSTNISNVDVKNYAIQRNINNMYRYDCHYSSDGRLFQTFRFRQISRIQMFMWEKRIKGITMERPTFSINRYDHEGDLYQSGIYLHFGETAIRVADNLKDYQEFIDHLKFMKKEISENC